MSPKGHRDHGPTVGQTPSMGDVGALPTSFLPLLCPLRILLRRLPPIMAGSLLPSPRDY